MNQQETWHRQPEFLRVWDGCKESTIRAWPPRPASGGNQYYLCVIAPIVLEASGDSPSAHIVTEEEAHSSPLPLLPLMLPWGLNGKGTERRKAKIPQLPR